MESDNFGNQMKLVWSSISALSIYYKQRRIQNLIKHLLWTFCENSQRLCGIHYFREKLHVRCQIGFRIRLCYIWCNPINRWYAYFYSARDETFYIFFCSSHSENVVFLLLVYNILLFRNHRVLFLVLLVVEFLPNLHNLILFLQEYFRFLILLNAIIECSA